MGRDEKGGKTSFYRVKKLLRKSKFDQFLNFGSGLSPIGWLGLAIVNLHTKVEVLFSPITKQISLPPHPYKKIPDIYLLRSCSSLMLSLMTKFHKRPITNYHPICCCYFIFFISVYRSLYCVILYVLCYLVSWPQN